MAQLGLEAKPDWSGLGRLSTAQPTSCGQESSISEGKPDWGGGGSVHSQRKGYVAKVIPKEPSSSRSEERKSPSWVAKLI